MRNKKLPTILGLVILTFGVATGVLLVQGVQIFRLGAAPEGAPKDVRITNIGSSSFSASWVSEEETTGFISWGENQDVGTVALGDSGVSGNTHLVNVINLRPETEYYFKITSGEKEFDNNGLAWQVKTAPTLETTQKATLISGTVLTATGEPAANVLVYVVVAGASPLSSITSIDGSWSIPVSTARNKDLKSWVDLNEQPVIEISVQGGPLGVATAQVYPEAANPVPPIILGQIHDFRNLPSSEEGNIPRSSVSPPSETATTPGFEATSEATPTSEEKSVSLQSFDEGEIITSANPEFFGEGPEGATLTITVESEPISDEIAVSSFGTWNWSPESALSEGVHKITISWRDSSGILRTLTRTFVVQAAEGPTFESTPSASTPTPTSTPTNTPTPTSSPTPVSTLTTTPSPTSTPTETPTPTPTSLITPTPIPEVPDSGSLTPTYVATIMGLVLLVFSGITTIFLSFSKRGV